MALIKPNGVSPANGERDALLAQFTQVGRLKDTPLDLPRKSEAEVVRHYTGLSHKNYSVDQGIYPLGSCTMKYNPKRNDKYANLDGFRFVHPLQPVEDMQGVLALLHALEGYIAKITGMDAVTLQPAAGAQGELTGLLVMRRYFRERDEKRDVLLIADSAHGTNPSSANMAGFRCKTIATNAQGMLDIEDLRSKMDSETAGLMITNPSTLGLFEERITEVADIVHGHGGVVYYDGANLNALMGLTRPGDMGFDIVHINVHKTLSTPHGGGGPGAGPLGVRGFLADYLPVPRIRRADDGSAYRLEQDGAASIGKLKQYLGHVSVLVRAYAYIRTLGAAGLRQASEDAILNANYLQHHLAHCYPPVFDKTCMHECLLSTKRLNAAPAALSRFLMKSGVHPPTMMGAGCVWFPEALSNTMLIEPTETESRESLDRFIEIMKEGHAAIGSAVDRVPGLSPAHGRQEAPHRQRSTFVPQVPATLRQ